MDFFPSLLETTFRFVLHVSYLAAVLTAVVLVLCAVGGRRIPARWRFALWLVVLGRFALPVAPASDWSLFNLADRFESRPVVDEPVVARVPHVADIPTSGREIAYETTGALQENFDIQTVEEPILATPPFSTPTVHRASPYALRLTWIQWLAFGWLIGAITLSIRGARLGLGLIVRQRSWIVPQDPWLRALLDACCRESGIRTQVALMVSPDIGPASLGVLRPRIVLPRFMLDHLSHEELRLVLLHELMHVRRRDVLTERIMSLLLIVHWMNPLAWLAAYRLRVERELACDAAVLDILDDRQRVAYGRVVLRIVELITLPRPMPGVVGIFARNRSIHRRIGMIMDHRKSSRIAACIGILLLLSLLITGWTNANPPVEVDSQSTPKPRVSSTTRTPSKRAESSPTVSLEGVCRDTDGKPLKSVRVTVYRYQVDVRCGIAMFPDPQKIDHQVTRADGKFRFVGLPEIPGKEPKVSTHYFLTAVSPGLGSTFTHVLPEKLLKSGIQIPMAKAGIVRGRVTDTSGKPIVGVDVWRPLDNYNPIRGFHHATTDVAGRFAIDDFWQWDRPKPPQPVKKDERDARYQPTEGEGVDVAVKGEGPGRFLFRHPDFATTWTAPKATGVVLEKAGVLEGRVIDAASGKPAANIPVFVRPVFVRPVFVRTPRRWHSQLMQTDERGRYRFGSLAADKYNLLIRDPERIAAAIDSIEVAVGETKQAPDIELIEGSWLEGLVVDAVTEKPFPQNDACQPLSIGLHGPSRPRSHWEDHEVALVDERGRFKLQVAPGKNYPFFTNSELWKRTQRREFYENGIEVGVDEVVSIIFRVLPKPPRRDPKPVPVRHAIPVPAEREAAAAIRRLGG